MAALTPAQKAYQREYYLKNKEARNAATRANYAKNRDARKARQRAWNAANRESRQEYELSRKYGITAEEKDALFKAQGRVCAICKTDAPTQQGWVVDHDHETQKVRGILCTRCNTGLGLFLDNKAALLSAVSYLDLHDELQRPPISVLIAA